MITTKKLLSVAMVFLLAFAMGFERNHENADSKILITENGEIYQSVGDGRNAQIIMSADNGDSWDTVAYGFQPTSAVVFDTHILWDLDGGPFTGVARYDRQIREMKDAFVAPPDFNGGSVYDMVLANGLDY